MLSDWLPHVVHSHHAKVMDPSRVVAILVDERPREMERDADVAPDLRTHMEAMTGNNDNREGVGEIRCLQ